MEVRFTKEQSDKIALLGCWLYMNAKWASPEFMALLDHAKDGIDITIEPLVYDHTKSQSRYYHKYCREFANYTGNTHDEMHDEILCAAYGSEIVQTKIGPRRRPLKRSSDAKRTEYSVLIDTLIRIAAECGFVIPPPMRGRENAA